MRRNRASKAEKFIDVARLCLETFVSDKLFVKNKISILNLFLYLIPLFLMIGLGYFFIKDENTLNNTEKVFNFAISATTQLLGFLISGFAIFAALADRDLVYLMKRIPATNKKVDSYYDQTQIYFFEPFIFFGSTCVLSFIGYLSLLVWPAVINMVPSIVHIKAYFSLLYGIYFYLLFLSFVSLKDFVFNIFQIGKLYSGFQLTRPDINESIKVMGDMLSKDEEKQ